MSNNDKEAIVAEIKVKVKEGNMPLLRSILVASGVVCSAIIASTTIIVNSMRDVQETKCWKETKAEPALKLYGEDRAVLVSKNILSQQFTTVKTNQ